MRKNALTASVMILFLSGFAACSEEKPKNDGGIPKAEISGSADESGIKFSIKVPADHHAYLDSGKEGNLIPVSFKFPEGKTPALKNAPKGIYEDFFHATVLRGTGEWEFTSENPAEMQGTTIKVTTQLCDDIKGICYRPSRTDVTLN